MLAITIATDAESWFVAHGRALAECWRNEGHRVQVVHHRKDIPNGDLLFLLSFWQLVDENVLARHRHNLVVHESPLPQGRGWSPVTWQVLEGKNRIPVKLFEAETSVDSGPIYLSDEMILRGDELIDEIRAEQARVTLQLCCRFVSAFPDVCKLARPQEGRETIYRRRIPADSQLNVDQSIREQFNLLRVVDNRSYPAFFELDGIRYNVYVDKADHHEPDCNSRQER